MDTVSVVIITKNEANNIVDCIESCLLISNDIIVIDSGSTDGTIAIAKQAGANIFTVPWQGYGYARNTGAELAKNEWILAIDADERVTPELVSSINNIASSSDTVIYGFKRTSYFLGKKIRFGDWGRDKVFRLYNRSHVSWDLSPVHEDLTGVNLTKKIIDGFCLHYTVINKQQNEEKVKLYAHLNAQKLFNIGKKATLIKRYLSPVFSFIQTYFLRLGFLDGKEGFIIAISIAKYVQLKYKLLHRLNEK